MQGMVKGGLTEKHILFVNVFITSFQCTSQNIITTFHWYLSQPLVNWISRKRWLTLCQMPAEKMNSAFTGLFVSFHTLHDSLHLHVSRSMGVHVSHNFIVFEDYKSWYLTLYFLLRANSSSPELLACWIVYHPRYSLSPCSFPQVCSKALVCMEF